MASENVQPSSTVPKEFIIADRYKLAVQVGSSANGTVYLGEDLVTQREIAVKVAKRLVKSLREEEEKLSTCLVLIQESIVLEHLRDAIGVPRMHHFGLYNDRDTIGGYYAMITDPLGPSLQDFFEYCGLKFSIKTILMLAPQLVTCIQSVHERGIIHNDVNPKNFLLGLYAKKNMVHVVNFGFSTKWRQDNNPSTKHIPNASPGDVPFKGNKLFASRNQLLGYGGGTRQDDLESIGYILIYFNRYMLSISAREKISQENAHLPGGGTSEFYFNGILPSFVRYMETCRALNFDEDPDYDYLRGLFQFEMEALGLKDDSMFDWLLQ